MPPPGRLLSAKWNAPLPGLLERTGVNADYFGALDPRVFAALHRDELAAERAALQGLPPGPETWSRLGRVAWLQGLHGEAASWFERAGRQSNPYAPGRAWHALAQLPSARAAALLDRCGWRAPWVRTWRRYARLRSAAAAARFFRPRPRETLPGPWLLAGLAAAAAGRRSAAVACFDRAASLRPDALEGFAALLGEAGAMRCGRSAARDRRVRRAAAALCARAPRTWWAWALQGCCRFGAIADEPSLARARRCLSEARRLRPRAGWLSALEAQALWHVSPVDAAAAARRACRRLPRRGWPRAWSGVLALMAGRKAAARRDLDAAAAADPDYPLSYVWRGRLHLSDGRLDAAERDLLTALGLRPAHAAALELYAHLRRERGDVAGALSALTRSAALEPETPRSFDPAGRGRSVKALSAFVAAHPGEPLARLWLGELLARSGRPVQARRELRRFAAAVRRSPEAAALRGWAFFWSGDAARARRLNPAIGAFKAC